MFDTRCDFGRNSIRLNIIPSVGRVTTHNWKDLAPKPCSRIKVWMGLPDLVLVCKLYDSMFDKPTFYQTWVKHVGLRRHDREWYEGRMSRLLISNMVPLGYGGLCDAGVKRWITVPTQWGDIVPGHRNNHPKRPRPTNVLGSVGAVWEAQTFSDPVVCRRRRVGP